MPDAPHKEPTPSAAEYEEAADKLLEHFHRCSPPCDRLHTVTLYGNEVMLLPESAALLRQAAKLAELQAEVERLRELKVRVADVLWTYRNATSWQTHPIFEVRLGTMEAAYKCLPSTAARKLTPPADEAVQRAELERSRVAES